MFPSGFYFIHGHGYCIIYPYLQILAILKISMLTYVFKDSTGFVTEIKNHFSLLFEIIHLKTRLQINTFVFHWNHRWYSAKMLLS